jgi:hypothetical protein
MSGGLLIAFGRLAMQPVRGFLGEGGGRENRPFVSLQDLQPAGDIGGMIRPRLAGQSQIRAEEGGAELGDKFFSGVGLRSKLALELSGASRSMASPMNFMPISA